MDHVAPGGARHSLGGPGRTVGTPGPDSGFALRLARRFEHELKLGEGESEHDVLLGVALVAAKRAALFGRGPSIYDVRLGAGPVGVPHGRATGAAVGAARALFSSISHDYVAQRRLVDSVPEEILRLSPDEAHGRGGATAGEVGGPSLWWTRRGPSTGSR